MGGTASCSGLGIVGEHGEHLLDEERIAFGRADDALPERRRDGFVVNQPPDELLGVALLSGESETSVVRGRGADQDGRASKRSGRERQSSRIAAPPGEAEDVLEQVEQRRLGPVDVVHHNNERSRDRDGLEELPERPGGLLGRALFVIQANCAGDEPRCDRAALNTAHDLHQRRLRISSGDFVHDVGERQVRDPLAVGDAAPDDHPSSLLE